MTGPAQQIDRICVVGAGNMGHQIALCAALTGHTTVCFDISSDAIRKAKQFADSYLAERVVKEKLTEAEVAQAQANLSFISNLEEGAATADLVIEAASENVETKRRLFTTLDEVCPTSTILATNSSFIVSSRIADATHRPDKVVNMHFFNPALVMKLVEVVQGPHVSPETVAATMAVAIRMGKVPVLLRKEISGFLVNRILAAVNQEALYLYDMGVASYEDIDTAVVYGLGHPMGPFRLLDLTGIDLAYHIGTQRYQETGDPIHKPSAIVVEKFVKGEWGQKAGKGFYEYEGQEGK